MFRKKTRSGAPRLKGHATCIACDTSQKIYTRYSFIFFSFFNIKDKNHTYIIQIGTIQKLRFGPKQYHLNVKYILIVQRLSTSSISNMIYSAIGL